MMKTVKGAGRAKHERNKKHQQLTPLPPRQGEQKTPEEYREETAELRESLQPKKRKKDKPAKESPAAEPAPAGKASALAAYAISVGWAAEVTEYADNKTGVVCTRDDERIVAGWQSEVWVAGYAKHTIGADRETSVRNASEARKLMATPPAEVARRVMRAPRGEGGEPKADAGSLVRRLPFDPETADDETVLAKVVGKRLTWINGITGGVETSSIPRTMFTKEVDKVTGQKLETERQTTNKHLRITRNSEGARILNWVEPAGFRSAYVGALVQVR